MPEHTSEELLTEFDRCPLNARYWAIFGLISAVAALDFLFFQRGFSGGKDRARLASDLRPVGDDPVRRRGRCGGWSAGLGGLVA